MNILNCVDLFIKKFIVNSIPLPFSSVKVTSCIYDTIISPLTPFKFTSSSPHPTQPITESPRFEAKSWAKSGHILNIYYRRIMIG